MQALNYSEILVDVLVSPIKYAKNIAKSLNVKVAKVDKKQGIVFGYAIVSKIDGEEYFDTQGDHIPEDSMLEATTIFMAGDRIAKDTHRGEQVGQVVFGLPIDYEIAESLEMKIRKTGFIVGMKPFDKILLEKYHSGEYTGFSIGGRRIRDVEVN